MSEQQIVLTQLSSLSQAASLCERGRKVGGHAKALLAHVRGHQRLPNRDLRC